MSFAAVCMIVACLLIMGSFSLVAVNVGNMLGELERDNEFLAYVDENLSEEEVSAMQGTLEAVPNVASVEFISKETAKEDYVEQYASGEDAELFLELPDEVFRGPVQHQGQGYCAVLRHSIGCGGSVWRSEYPGHSGDCPGLCGGKQRSQRRRHYSGGHAGSHVSVYHCQHHQAGHLYPAG